MARETTCVKEMSLPIPFNCADGTGIEKGAILKLTDNMTVELADGDTDIVAGIAAAEKIAGNGITTIPVYTDGIFQGYAGAAGVSVGDAIITDVSTGDTNELVSADVNSENIVGRAYETATDGNKFLFQLNPFTVNLA